MQRLLNLLGALFVLAGTVWILQGVSVLPGSFMTGQIQWAYYGFAAAVLGVFLIHWANRRSPR